MIQGSTVMYKAFLIVEYPIGMMKAYRNLDYYKNDITSYELAGAANWLGVIAMIDEAEDYGEFTEEQYAELTGVNLVRDGQTPEELAEVIQAMPFMPEKGEPLPEYVAKELYPSSTLELMEMPVSDYGRVVADDTARLLKEFMQGGSFELKEKFEEGGWSSEDIIYTGDLIHTLTGTQYLVEIYVSFEWRDPTKVGFRSVSLFREVLGEPEEVWGGDLDLVNGQEADKVLRELQG